MEEDEWVIQEILSKRTRKDAKVGVTRRVESFHDKEDSIRVVTHLLASTASNFRQNGGGQPEYLVRWEGYTPGDDSWCTPEEFLDLGVPHFEDAIVAFNVSRKAKKKLASQKPKRKKEAAVKLLRLGIWYVVDVGGSSKEAKRSVPAGNSTRTS